MTICTWILPLWLCPSGWVHTIFFDWDLDGSADHVGIVVGTDGSRVYTVEGNSGDACKIKSYDLNYQSIKGYGLMNW